MNVTPHIWISLGIAIIAVGICLSLIVEGFLSKGASLPEPGEQDDPGPDLRLSLTIRE
jgi:hypothetical protein